MDENDETATVEITAVASTDAATEDGTQSVTVTINDDDTAALKYSHISGSTSVTEGGSTDRYLVKNLSVPPGSSVEIVQSGAKIVLQSADVVKGLCGTANGIDAWISVVDAISE